MVVSDNVIKMFKTKEPVVDIQKMAREALDTIAETQPEGKRRCMDLLNDLTKGSKVDPDRRESKDKKNDAHFEAKNRL